MSKFIEHPSINFNKIDPESVAPSFDREKALLLIIKRLVPHILWCGTPEGENLVKEVKKELNILYNRVS